MERIKGTEAQKVPFSSQAAATTVRRLCLVVGEGFLFGTKTKVSDKPYVCLG
jgi:hypothetical protein